MQPSTRITHPHDLSKAPNGRLRSLGLRYRGSVRNRQGTVLRHLQQEHSETGHVLIRRLKEDEIPLRRAGVGFETNIREGLGGVRRVSLTSIIHEASVPSVASVS
jgi:hypothetical protein